MKTEELALSIRIGVVEQIKARGFGHIGGSLSVCDLLAVLYGEVMRYRPEDPKWPDRDKLVCSKGHAGPAVYAALGLKGFFPYEEILTLNQPGTNFPSHCDRNKTPGVDMTTGSLGQGTSLGVGMALGDKLKGRDSKIYLIVGDGELDEGQVWEAAMFSSAKKLSNLYWFIDYNKKQLDGPVEWVMPTLDIRKKFEAFGFHAQFVPGNDVKAIREAIDRCADVTDRPHAIVLDTIKGEGVKEVMETEYNHSMSPSAETSERWLNELRGRLEAMKGGVTA